LVTAPGASGQAGPVDLPAVLGALGLDPTRRPETLTGTEYVRLADALFPGD
jgi:hypothetical protein